MAINRGIGLDQRYRRVDFLGRPEHQLADVAEGSFRVRNPVGGPRGIFDEVCVWSEERR